MTPPSRNTTGATGRLSARSTNAAPMRTLAAKFFCSGSAANRNNSQDRTAVPVACIAVQAVMTDSALHSIDMATKWLSRLSRS